MFPCSLATYDCAVRTESKVYEWVFLIDKRASSVVLETSPFSLLHMHWHMVWTKILLA